MNELVAVIGGLSGLLAGMLLGVIITIQSDAGQRGLEAKALIEECEVHLPRDRNCVLQAVEEKGDE